MMNKSTYRTLLITFGVLLLLSEGCQNNNTIKNNDVKKVRLMVLDPGHFHAALVQKSMYTDVDPIVHVYAPQGPDVASYLALIDQYNSRADHPTRWQEKVYTGDDYLDKMFVEKPGNLVILAGNNQKKTAYIKKSVDAGFNVLADKPMASTVLDFELLKAAFDSADKAHVLLYDIMTSRYEITNILEKELAHSRDLFGELEKGTQKNPAIIKQSTHHFFKTVSGMPLIRPAWYFDTDQEGNGIVDVTTHLVDLVQWECFDEAVLNYKKDIDLLSAKRWATKITAAQFRQVTNETSFPDYLQKDVDDGSLNVFSNGEINYTIKGMHAKISVTWNFQAPDGAADSYYSIMRGTRANLIIRQGKEQHYKPMLFIEPAGKIKRTEFEILFKAAIKKIEHNYPGISLLESKAGWQIIIPDRYKTDHEQQFESVTKKYLYYLHQGSLPGWEVSFMLTKYFTTTKALEIALHNGKPDKK